jgi:hypothetical protein
MQPARLQALDIRMNFPLGEPEGNHFNVQFS